MARTHDMDRKHMIETFRRAHEHKGAAFVEVYQNCNVFNDGAFEAITAKERGPTMLIELHHGEPIRFGAESEHGVALNEFGECELAEIADVGEEPAPRPRRAPGRPRARVRAVPARRPTDDADPDGRVPRRGPPDLRGRGAAPGRGGRRTGRAPVTWRR